MSFTGKDGLDMGQVIAVTSGKGGTGKTTVSAAISCCLAAEGYKVLCIDADVGLRNLDISLGMADMAPISFADVLARRYTLDDATPHPQIDGLYLLTAPVIDRPEAISFQAFGQMLQAVRARFDFCVIDTQAGRGDGFQLATVFADRILVVATPDPASMRDASSVTEQLSLMGKTDVKLVVNRIQGRMFRKMRLTVDDMMDDVGLSLIGIIPEDDNVVFAAAGNTPLVLYTDQGAALACLHIARRLCGKKVPLLRLR